MRLFRFCLLLGLVAIVLGCGDSITDPQEKQFDPIFPIEAGSWWAVRTPFYSVIDTLRYIPTDRAGADNETDWFTVSWKSNEGINQMLAKQTENGLVYSWDTTKKKPYSLLGMQTGHKIILPKDDKGGSDNDNFASYLVAKFPIEFNETWIMMSEETTDNSCEPATINDQMECINLSQDVETPAGTFSCIVYRETYEFEGDFNVGQSSDFIRYYYYSEGVGLVKVLFVDNIEIEVTVEYELVDYHLE